MTDKLTSLRQYTTVVADTGDIAAMKLYQPQDATTNPSLILGAAQIPEYRKLIDDAVEWARSQSSDSCSAGCRCYRQTGRKYRSGNSETGPWPYLNGS
ncbi:Transaldolase [Kluyvera cryocrescens]|uniref:Transaldolase n=1 Tax=Kluyvera cryocrescens TaxID=580 RepID=A0A485BG31_KLUCR|nr:Transaldolase [Kluyvera cryocrescens]